MLALIGAGWIDAADPAGRRRLDDPHDFVRIEIREALRRGIPVVPVLLDDAAMPAAENLPDDLKSLVRRQAEAVQFRTFDTDVARLMQRLDIDDPEDLDQPEARQPSKEDLLRIANERDISQLVSICSELSRDIIYEQPRRTYGGSFRYWYKPASNRTMILGVNVSGVRFNTPPGKLDVWIPVRKLAEVVSVVSENGIRRALHDRVAATDAGISECIVRLTTPEQARELVSLLREWIRTPPPARGIGKEASQSTPAGS